MHSVSLDPFPPFLFGRQIQRERQGGLTQYREVGGRQWGMQKRTLKCWANKKGQKPRRHPLMEEQTSAPLSSIPQGRPPRLP